MEECPKDNENGIKRVEKKPTRSPKHCHGLLEDAFMLLLAVAVQRVESEKRGFFLYPQWRAWIFKSLLYFQSSVLLIHVPGGDRSRLWVPATGMGGAGGVLVSWFQQAIGNAPKELSPTLSLCLSNTNQPTN